MNPIAKARGLSLSLRRLLFTFSSPTGRDKRLHDGSPGNVDGSHAISVIGVATRDTTKHGLTLAVRPRTMPTGGASTTSVARVYRMQGNARKRGLVGKKETELPK